MTTSGRTFLLATRNAHKRSEIRDLLRGLDLEVVGPDEAGVEGAPPDAEVESAPTFEENALAKARWYHEHSGLPTLADDSGLCVDALGGGPGVRSRRFAPAERRSGGDEDAANNAWLLERLEGIPAGGRGAHYACALALVSADVTVVVTGRVHGRIADEEKGGNGFGYDPLFVPVGEDHTFGELPPRVKAERSHRSEAVRRMRPWLSWSPDGSGAGG